MNTLTWNQTIKDGQTIVSSGGLFELGFFTPKNSTNRYVGIWYHKIRPQGVVWVANREYPVKDSRGLLKIGEDGNLVVLDGSEKAIWSTDSSFISTRTTAVLMDSGNLVLREENSKNNSEIILWQSFDHPTDAFLPGMKLRISTKSKNRFLTSWKNSSDPAVGTISFGTTGSNSDQLWLWRSSVSYWNGTLNDSQFEKISENDTNNFFFSKIGNGDEAYITYFSTQNLTRLVLDVNGLLSLLVWRTGFWWRVWYLPKPLCTFESCGPYSSCSFNGAYYLVGVNSGNDYRTDGPCACITNFEPVSQEAWELGDFSGGCKRKTPLQCGKEEDGFYPLKNVKAVVPTSAFEAATAESCRTECLSRCSCNAYAYTNGSSAGIISCLIWDGSLRVFTGETKIDPSDIFVRIDASEIVTNRRLCQNCGIHAIPYPLSTGPNCGDPAYRNFKCDDSTGYLTFNALDSSYAVNKIIPEMRTIVIKWDSWNFDSCYAKNNNSDIQLNPSLPFHMTSNNTIFMFNCPSPLRSSGTDCNSSSLCPMIMLDKMQCFSSMRTCCSYIAGKSSSTLHRIGVLNTGCEFYASVHNDLIRLPASDWSYGVEIGWESPLEPFCNLPKDCEDWPHSACMPERSGTGNRKCICISSFRWDPLVGYCTKERSWTRRSLSVIIPVTTIVGLLFLGTISRWWRGKMFKENGRIADKFRGNGKEELDVPFFDFRSIAAATENFSDSNKLGQGGFGPVYKGKLSGGQEIAVKRLSRTSGQGLEEFKTEIILIAKLQHRNLVRLLGCCIQGDEMLLLYEYMPKKSLDYFLFDQNHRKFLDWEKRFTIIVGIARGLLYLHQDSRLRIIHRDLKTSNILLDDEFNPKISDFGMARIFGGNQTQANTNRVVGTYGYMSPEYALDGLFSTKSDVFSFGVVLLEIVTGKKTTSFYHSENSFSLLGYAWRLWSESKGSELIDPLLVNEARSDVKDVIKCIHLGLLCVQEDATDRPSMASIVTMLTSETMDLVTPKKPAFFIRESLLTQSSSSGPDNCSKNELTASMLEGR
ncbi:hypothetical protein IFM89_004730 [Coptis chinensis]|uniref:Uncharacterized protein n=1 Tax=Coptis chinensis TaxID=261450 RepID=A0A835LA45_9MAGN|nr:hypothetical protein IFM89_004730 [Coptis chinensis]